MKAEKLLARNKRILYKEFMQNEHKYKNIAWLFSDKESFDTFSRLENRGNVFLCKFNLQSELDRIRMFKIGPFSTACLMENLEKTAREIKGILQDLPQNPQSNVKKESIEV